MDKHEEQIRRADEASSIVNSPMFAAAFEDTRQALLNAIASLDSVQNEQARDLHAMVKGLDKVKRCIEVHIQTGRLASKELERRSKIADLNPFKRRA